MWWDKEPAKSNHHNQQGKYALTGFFTVDPLIAGPTLTLVVQSLVHTLAAITARVLITRLAHTPWSTQETSDTWVWINNFGCWSFTSLQNVMSYQDGYWRHVTVHTHGDLTVLSHWEIRPLAPWADYPMQSHYADTERTLPYPIYAARLA